MAYHQPVLLRQAIDALNINPNGLYVDATFGGGGHATAILQELTTGRLFGFDQDPDAREEAASIQSKNFQFIESNFRYLEAYLTMHGVQAVDGILADLGVSSHQIDTPNRGFSTRFDAPLHMRMDAKSAFDAREVLETYSEDQLKQVFSQYGEMQQAGKVARTLVSARKSKIVETVNDFIELLRPFAPRGKEYKFFAQAFQALRIEVNDEMSALKTFLAQAAKQLKPGGRLVVISYHSLEDRLVKHFFRTGNFEGESIQDIYGNQIRPLEPVVRKPIVPDQEELNRNPRSRSAKMRIATRKATT